MTATEKREEIVRLYLSRKEKNGYTQGADRVYFFGKPEGAAKGYSDCSSSVRAVYQKLLGLDIGSNTEAQALSKKGTVVDRTDGLYPDEANLKPGDTLYFKGNSAHAEGVGHVELYIGDGQCAGHGSGTGPKVHNMRSYCQSRGKAKRYYKAMRWIPDDIVPANPAKEMKAEPTSGIRITGGTVNIRKGPGTQYGISMVATKGQAFEAVDTTGWRPVCVNGAVLWVSEAYSERIAT